MSHPPRNTEIRFWEKVDSSGGAGRCWPWRGGQIQGYGRFWVYESGEKVQASRYSYVLAHGPILKEQRLSHSCGNTLCVNPAHLSVLSIPERFFLKVVKSAGCWRWTGARGPDGYGGFWNGEQVIASHRFSYELHVAPIPAGLTIDHLCRNPNCVNPSHLEAVTKGENMMRGVARFRHKRKICCPQGHLYTEKNTLWERKSERASHSLMKRCRICRKAAQARSSKKYQMRPKDVAS